MKLWNWLTGRFDHGGGIAGDCSPPHTEINPATGLPMIGGMGGIDLAGNPYGTNFHDCQSQAGLSAHSSLSSGLDHR